MSASVTARCASVPPVAVGAAVPASSGAPAGPEELPEPLLPSAPPALAPPLEEPALALPLEEPPVSAGANADESAQYRPPEQPGAAQSARSAAAERRARDVIGASGGAARKRRAGSKDAKPPRRSCRLTRIGSPEVARNGTWPDASAPPGDRARLGAAGSYGRWLSRRSTCGFVLRNASVSRRSPRSSWSAPSPSARIRACRAGSSASRPTQPRSPPVYSRRGVEPIVRAMISMLSLTFSHSAWPRLNTLIGSRPCRRR